MSTWNVDADPVDADWIKTLHWDLPTDPDRFLAVIGGRSQLAAFMHLPAARAMPRSLRSALAGKVDKYSADQDRDERGRFADEGGGGDAAREAPGATHDYTQEKPLVLTSPGKAVADQIRAAIPGSTVDLSQVDPPLHASIRDGLLAMNAAYPDVLQRMPLDIRADHPLGFGIQAITDTQTPESTGVGRPATNIALSPDSRGGFGDARSLRAELANAAGRGWSPPGASSVDAVLVHEFAHAIDASTGRAGTLLVRSFSDDPSQLISGYAARNDHERFAEDVTAVRYTPEAQWTPDVRATAEFLTFLHDNGSVATAAKYGGDLVGGDPTPTKVDRPAVAKYSEDQARDERGRFTAEGGDGVAVANEPNPGAATISALERGATPNLRPDEVAGLMTEALAYQGPPLDLTNVTVLGTHQFGQDGLGYSRDQMPQIPRSFREQFFDHLRAAGTTVKEVSFRPADLQPSQKEINLARVAASYKAQQDGATLPRIIVSADKYVIDGHHQWGASVALSFVDPSTRIDAVQIGMDARSLIADAKTWSDAQGIAPRELFETMDLAKYNDNHDERGRFADADGAGGTSRSTTAAKDTAAYQHLVTTGSFDGYGGLAPNDYGAGSSGDRFATDLAIQMGLGGPPTIASPSEIDAAVAHGAMEMFRGSEPEFNDALRTGEVRLGNGVAGSGYYVSTNHFTAEGYGSSVVRMALKDDAKVVSLDDARKGAGDESRSAIRAAGDYQPRNPTVEWFGQTYAAKAMADPGRWAIEHGYDAIRVPPATGSGITGDNYVIVNRTALLVSATDQP